MPERLIQKKTQMFSTLMQEERDRTRSSILSFSSGERGFSSSSAVFLREDLLLLLRRLNKDIRNHFQNRPRPKTANLESTPISSVDIPFGTVIKRLSSGKTAADAVIAATF